MFLKNSQNAENLRPRKRAVGIMQLTQQTTGRQAESNTLAKEESLNKEPCNGIILETAEGRRDICLYQRLQPRTEAEQLREAGHYERLMFGWDLDEASAARGAQLSELPAGQSAWQAFGHPVGAKQDQ